MPVGQINAVRSLFTFIFKKFFSRKYIICSVWYTRVLEYKLVLKCPLFYSVTIFKGDVEIISYNDINDIDYRCTKARFTDLPFTKLDSNKYAV